MAHPTSPTETKGLGMNGPLWVRGCPPTQTGEGGAISTFVPQTREEPPLSSAYRRRVPLSAGKRRMPSFGTRGAVIPRLAPPEGIRRRLHCFEAFSRRVFLFTKVSIFNSVEGTFFEKQYETSNEGRYDPELSLKAVKAIDWIFPRYPPLLCRSQ